MVYFSSRPISRRFFVFMAGKISFQSTLETIYRLEITLEGASGGRQIQDPARMLS